MTDRAYLRRRAAEEAGLASRAADWRTAAAHEAMAAAYLKELARLDDLDAGQSQRQSPLRP